MITKVYYTEREIEYFKRKLDRVVYLAKRQPNSEEKKCVKGLHSNLVDACNKQPHEFGHRDLFIISEDIHDVKSLISSL